MEKVRETKKSAALRLQQAKRDFANAQSQQAAERAEQEVKDAGVALEESKALEEPPRPPEQEEDEEDDIPEIFFKHPQELLERYRELESKNLFLIQNIQVRPGQANPPHCRRPCCRPRMSVLPGIDVAASRLLAAALCVAPTCSMGGCAC